jgi:hypothetical protein
MADRVKIAEYLDAEEALRLARQGADHFNENYRIFEETRGKMGLDPDLPYNQRNEKLIFDEYDAAVRRHNAARASLGDALYGPEVSAERSRRIKAMDIPDEIFDELGPERDPIPSRRPAGSEAAHRHGATSKPRPSGERGFIRGVAPSARSTAARGLSTAMGVAASPIIDYALDPESRTPVQFARAQEEFITGLPGLVSPSELPPPAVLPPDRLKAVEATQGIAGVAPDTKSPNVTEQEVRAYISNKVAKGEKLPAWAEKITSMKGGRLSIKPVNPRTKARQEAAKRPRTWSNVLD